MRIVHTADWHIGKIVNEHSMLEDQKYVLCRLIEDLRELKADVLIIAGDLYDRALPAKEAVMLVNDIFTRIIQELDLPILVIAGNHDSNERLEYGAALLENSRLYIEGTVKPVTRKIQIKGVIFYLLPFSDYAYIRELLQNPAIKSLENALQAQLNQIKETLNPQEVNVLIAHEYVVNGSADSMETTDSERPLSIGTAEYVAVEMFEDFDYVALGHLHMPQKVKHDKIRYSGSPLKYSKSEARHKKQIMLVDLEKEHLSLEPLNIRPLRDLRVIKGLFSECMEQQSEDYIFFELTDEEYVMDAMNQLRRRFPNAMGLEYVRQKKSASPISGVYREQLKSLEIAPLFAEFYREYKGKALDKERLAVVSETLEQVEKEEHI